MPGEAQGWRALAARLTWGATIVGSSGYATVVGMVRAGIAAEPDTVDRTGWVARAACRTGDPERLFVRGAAQRKATSICRGCPVQLECLADALDNRVEFGVWGGLTERERRAVLRNRPDVTSWAEHLSAYADWRDATAQAG